MDRLPGLAPRARGRVVRAGVLLEAALTPVGFGRDEDVLPAWPHALPGYRLVQEYIQFPAKYHFFDLDGLERCRARQRLDIHFLFRQMPQAKLAIDRETVLLGCAPIQNLFYRTTEPIRIDHRQAEYRLVGDLRREAITEIHSIQSVSASSDPQKPTQEIQPFFSFRHEQPDESPTYWHARRAPTGRVDLVGTDLWISFVDPSFRPGEPPMQVVYAHTLCTNHELAVQIAAGAELQIEDAAPLSRITCLTRPTETAPRGRRGDAVEAGLESGAQSSVAVERPREPRRAARDPAALQLLGEPVHQPADRGHPRDADAAGRGTDWIRGVAGLLPRHARDAAA